MKAQDNPIRKAVLALVQSRPGISCREMTKHLKAQGFLLNRKTLPATLRRMCGEGTLSRTGEHMSHLYWFVGEVVKIEEGPEITQIILPARPGEFNFPHFATPLQWSMAHLLGA